MLISVSSPCINHTYCSIMKTRISMVSESESLYLNLCLKYHNLWYVFAVFGFIFCCLIFSVHNHGPMSLNHWNLISPFHWLNPSSMPCLELVLRQFRGHPCSVFLVRRGSNVNMTTLDHTLGRDMAMQRHGCPTQLAERIMQLKDDEILDNTIIFRIATDNKVHFYRLVAHSNCHNGYPW